MPDEIDRLIREYADYDANGRISGKLTWDAMGGLNGLAYDFADLTGCRYEAAHDALARAAENQPSA